MKLRDHPKFKNSFPLTYLPVAGTNAPLKEVGTIQGAQPLSLLGDSITIHAIWEGDNYACNLRCDDQDLLKKVREAIQEMVGRPVGEIGDIEL